MPPPDSLTIAPKREGAKTRAHSVSLTGLVTADMYWTGGTAAALRPLYLSFLAPERDARRCAANLRTGRPAIVTDQNGHEVAKRVEITKGAGMRWVSQSLPDGIAHVTGYMPALCARDPGPLPERIRFLFAPPSWWIEAQAAELVTKANLDTLASYGAHGGAREAALGGYLALMLDRRTVWPLLTDPRFYARLYRAASVQGWWRTTKVAVKGGIFSYPQGAAPAGVEALAMVSVEHGVFREFLAAETARFLREVGPDVVAAAPRVTIMEDGAAVPFEPEGFLESESVADEVESEEPAVVGPATIVAPAEKSSRQLSMFDFI